jgi:hypothetical protein
MQTRYLGISERDDFVQQMNDKLSETKRDGSLRVPMNVPFRIHVTGDFHSPEYVKKWVQILKDNPKRKFYAYTKSHDLDGIEELEKLPNMVVRHSYGSSADDKIDPKKPHCKVFNTKEELDEAGYTECTDDDRVAADSKVVKLGIVKHGTRKYDSQFKPHAHASAESDEYPIAHLYDQIDAPHHWEEEEHAAHQEAGSHHTQAEWLKHLPKLQS